MTTGTGGAGGASLSPSAAPALAAARAAKARLRALLAGRPGVCGVGLVRTPEGWALRVDVEDPACVAGVPREVDGVRVLTRVTGRLAPCGERGEAWATTRRS